MLALWMLTRITLPSGRIILRLGAAGEVVYYEWKMLGRRELDNFVSRFIVSTEDLCMLDVLVKYFSCFSKFNLDHSN